jgi:hypothetical protein
MNNAYNGSGVTFSINGKTVGTIQSFDTEIDVISTPEKEIKNGDNLSMFSLSREATITMENIELNDNFVRAFLPMKQTYKVIATKANYPRGSKLPKKKRIRNKWIKKYHQEITLDNCVIV